MGSPRAVPVPWSWSEQTEIERSPFAPAAAAAADAADATARACLIAADCEGPCGAVSPEERPSWLTAEPASSANGGGEKESPEEEARAEESSAAAAPSPRPYPSADASSALQRPSADSMPVTPKAAALPGESIKLTEAAREMVEGSEEEVFGIERASAARWRATSAEEQAVSTATAGPPSAKAYESLPAATDAAAPAAECAVGGDLEERARSP